MENNTNIIESLNELIKDKTKNNNDIREIDIDKIKFFFQDRKKDFTNDISFAELVASIKQNGLLQPIVVYQTLEKDFYKVAGGRRIEAYKTLGYKKIPAVILKEEDINRKEILKLIIEENEKRENLNKNEKTEFLLKALVHYFNDKENNKEELNDEELIENGKNIFKNIYNVLRKKELNENETDILLTWKEFAENFNINLLSFYDDIRLYSTKEPFKKFYNKHKIFNKKLVLKINVLTKYKNLFIGLKEVFLLIDKKIEKEGEKSEKLKENLNKLINDILNNKEIIADKMNNTIEKLKKDSFYSLVNQNILSLIAFLLLIENNNINIENLKNEINHVDEEINQSLNKKLKEIFNSFNLEQIKINLDSNKKIEKEIKSKIRKINKKLKEIDLENIELEILNKKLEELIAFLEKGETK